MSEGKDDPRIAQTTPCRDQNIGQLHANEPNYGAYTGAPHIPNSHPQDIVIHIEDAEALQAPDDYVTSVVNNTDGDRANPTLRWTRSERLWGDKSAESKDLAVLSEVAPQQNEWGLKVSVSETQLSRLDTLNHTNGPNSRVGGAISTPSLHTSDTSPAGSKFFHFRNKQDRAIQQFCLTYQGQGDPLESDVCGSSTTTSQAIPIAQTQEDALELRRQPHDGLNHISNVLPLHLSPLAVHSPLPTLNGDLLEDYCYNPQRQKTLKEEALAQFRILQTLALSKAETVLPNPSSIPVNDTMLHDVTSTPSQSKPQHQQIIELEPIDESDPQTKATADIVRRITLSMGDRFSTPSFLGTRSFGDQSDQGDGCEIELAKLGSTTTAFHHSHSEPIVKTPMTATEVISNTPMFPDANQADTDVIALYNFYNSRNTSGSSAESQGELFDPNNRVQKGRGCLAWCRTAAHNIILHPSINWLYVVLLCVQIALLCLAVEAAINNKSEATWLTAVDGTVVMLFALEVVLRLVAVGEQYFTVFVNVIDLFMLVVILVFWGIEIAYPRSLGPLRTAVLVVRFLGRALRILLITRHWAQTRRMISAADAGIDLDGYEAQQDQAATAASSAISQMVVAQIRTAAAEDDIQQAREDAEEALAQRNQDTVATVAALAATGDPLRHCSHSNRYANHRHHRHHSFGRSSSMHHHTLPGEPSALVSSAGNTLANISTNGAIGTSGSTSSVNAHLATLGWRLAGTRELPEDLTDVEISVLESVTTESSSSDDNEDIESVGSAPSTVLLGEDANTNESNIPPVAPQVSSIMFQTPPLIPSAYSDPHDLGITPQLVLTTPSSGGGVDQPTGRYRSESCVSESELRSNVRLPPLTQTPSDNVIRGKLYFRPSPFTPTPMGGALTASFGHHHGSLHHHNAKTSQSAFAFFQTKSLSVSEALKGNPLVAANHGHHRRTLVTPHEARHASEVLEENFLAALPVAARSTFSTVRDTLLRIQRGFCVSDVGELNYSDHALQHAFTTVDDINLGDFVGHHMTWEQQVLCHYVASMEPYVRPRLALWPSRAAAYALTQEKSQIRRASGESYSHITDLANSSGSLSRGALSVASFGRPRTFSKGVFVDGSHSPSGVRANIPQSTLIPSLPEPHPIQQGVDVSTAQLSVNTLETWCTRLASAADASTPIRERAPFSRLVSNESPSLPTASDLWLEIELALGSTGRAWLYTTETLALRQDMCEAGLLSQAVALARTTALLGCTPCFAIPLRSVSTQLPSRPWRPRSNTLKPDASLTSSEDVAANSAVLPSTKLTSTASATPIQINSSLNAIEATTDASYPFIAVDERSAAGEFRVNLLSQWLSVWGNPSATSLAAAVSAAALLPTSVDSAASALAYISKVPHMLSRLRLRRPFRALIESVEHRVSANRLSHNHLNGHSTRHVRARTMSNASASRSYFDGHAQFPIPLSSSQISSRINSHTGHPGRHGDGYALEGGDLSSHFLSRHKRTYSLQDSTETYAFSRSGSAPRPHVPLFVNQGVYGHSSDNTVVTTHPRPLSIHHEVEILPTILSPEAVNSAPIPVETAEVHNPSLALSPETTKTVELAKAFWDSIQHEIDANAKQTLLTNTMHYVDSRGIHIARKLQNDTSSPSNASGSRRSNKSNLSTVYAPPTPNASDEAARVSSGFEPQPLDSSRRPSRAHFAPTELPSFPSGNDSRFEMGGVHRRRQSFFASPGDVAVLSHISPSLAADTAVPIVEALGNLPAPSSQGSADDLIQGHDRANGRSTDVASSLTRTLSKAKPARTTTERSDIYSLAPTNTQDHLAIILPISHNESGDGNSAVGLSSHSHERDSINLQKRLSDESTRDSLIQNYLETLRPGAALAIARELFNVRSKRLATLDTLDQILSSHSTELRVKSTSHDIVLTGNPERHNQAESTSIDKQQCLAHAQHGIRSEMQMLRSQLLDPITSSLGVSPLNHIFAAAIDNEKGQRASKPTSELEYAPATPKTEGSSCGFEEQTITLEPLQVPHIFETLLVSPSARTACQTLDRFSNTQGIFAGGNGVSPMMTALPSTLGSSGASKMWILRREGFVGYGHGIEVTLELQLLPEYWISQLHNLVSDTASGLCLPSLTSASSHIQAARQDKRQSRPTTSSFDPNELVVADPVDGTWSRYVECALSKRAARSKALALAGYDTHTLDIQDAEEAWMRYVLAENISVLTREQELRLASFYQQEANAEGGKSSQLSLSSHKGEQEHVAISHMLHSDLTKSEPVSKSLQSDLESKLGIYKPTTLYVSNHDVFYI